MRRRRQKKQRNIIIISFVSMLFIMSIGYAAFQTNLNIAAKGNILEKPITIQELKAKVVTSGDGLYKNEYETDRYIYRGGNPSNYIEFDNSLWRILSVESNGTLKIIKNDSIGSMPWDVPGTRDSSTSTYCKYASSYGCNAWAANSTLVNTPSMFITTPHGDINTDALKFSGTVTVDASINTYLNTTFYSGIIDKGNMVKGNYYVGTPGGYDADWGFTDTDSISKNIEQEKNYIWNGYVGFITASEYMNASLSSACTNLSIARENGNACGDSNWLKYENDYRTISPAASHDIMLVWTVSSDGILDSTLNASKKHPIRPVLYLKADIKLSGKGTEGRPYQIVS